MHRSTHLSTFLGLAISLSYAQAQHAQTRFFQANPGDTIIVHNDYGRVSVKAGSSSQIEVRYRKNIERQRLSEVEVVAQKSGNKVFLQSYFFDYRSETVDFDILAPASVNLVVWGANPAVELENIRGYVRVQTLTGQVTARNLNGPVSILTEYGDVTYTSTLQLNKEVRLESVSGRVTCRLAPGLNARAWMRAGGRLRFNDAVELHPGQLEKQLGSGGPLLYAGSLTGDVEFKILASGEAAELPAVIARRPPPPRPPTSRDRTEPAHRDSRTVRTIPERGDSQTEPQLRTSRGPVNAGAKPSAPTPVDPDAPGVALGAPTFRADVNLINLNISVRDRRSNRSVPNLTREDFIIYEDGMEQVVRRLDSIEAPISLLLLLDVSGSTKEYINLIRDASVDFTREIKENDQVAVATFNSRVRLIQDFTSDRREVERSLRRIRSGGGTAFYDALYTSVSDYMSGVEGRKAIVVFSDGVDNQLSGDYSNGSRITFGELFREIQEIDSTIYNIFLDTRGRISIGNRRGGGRRGSVIDVLEEIMRRGGSRGGSIPFPGNDDEYEEARTQMEAISEQTGGRMYAPREIDDLRDVYSEIADDLRIQYTVAYTSTNYEMDGAWREIRVKIRNRPEWVARTRRGYYAGKKPPPSRSNRFSIP